MRCAAIVAIVTLLAVPPGISQPVNEAARPADATENSPSAASPAQTQPAPTAAQTQPAPTAAQTLPAADPPVDPSGSEASTVAQQQEPRDLKVGVLLEAPPFSICGRFGIRTGFDVEIALAVCERMGASCQLTTIAPSDMARELGERRLDMIVASVGQSGLDDTISDYSQPYVRVSAQFVVPREAPLDLDGGDDTRFGTVVGSPYADYLLETYPQEGVVRLYEVPDEMWLALALGRIGAVLSTAAIARGAVLATPMGSDFRLVPPTGASESVRARPASIAVRKGDEGLLPDVNTALADLLSSTEYTDMLRRHLGGGRGDPPVDPASIDRPDD